VELILGMARRRWSDEQKRTLVAETFLPGASVTAVARRHEMNPSMLFTWRKRFRAELGFPEKTEGVGFAAVAIAAPEEGAATTLSPPRAARISVEFSCGARMTVTGAVDPTLAVAVAKALAQR